MGAVVFAWVIGVVFYALAWACPFPALAFFGYVFSAYFFLAATYQAWARSRE